MKGQLKDARYRKSAVSRGHPYPLESQGRSERRRVMRDPTEQQRMFSAGGAPATFAPLLAAAWPILQGALTAGATALGTAAVKGIADGITNRAQQWSENKTSRLTAQQKKGAEYVKSGGDYLANRITGQSGGVEGVAKNWVMNVGRKKPPAPAPAPAAPEPPVEAKPTPPTVKPDIQARANPTPPMQTAGPTAVGQMPTGRPVSRRPSPMYDDEEEYYPRYRRPAPRRYYDDYDTPEVRGPRPSSYRPYYPRYSNYEDE